MKPLKYNCQKKEKKKAPFRGTFFKKKKEKQKNTKICNILLGFVLSYLSY